jgi:hypothetical protein
MRLNSVAKDIKNGGRIIEKGFRGLKDNTIVRGNINTKANLSILGQRGKIAYVVLDKSMNIKRSMDYISTGTGIGQAFIYITVNGHN